MATWWGEVVLRRIKKVIANPRWALVKAARMVFRQRIPGYCAVCGQDTVLYKAGPRPTETYSCKYCGAIARNRHLAVVLCRLLELPEPYSLRKVVQTSPELRIYEVQAKGSIHDVLMTMPGYTCSEYFADVPPGSHSRGGIRCEDLQNLSFTDNSFDLIITQTIFEHIRESDAAWLEVRRVLKPGGYHLFTIPYLPDQKTRQRVVPDGDEDIFVLPKVYHGDGIRDGLVYTDFGCDLPDHLEQMGLPTQVYPSEGLGGPPHQIYHGWVFVSQKRA